LINVLAQPLNQAELERKGKVFMNSEFFIMTTNDGSLPHNMKVQDRGAVERRFPFRVEVSVRPEFGVPAFDPLRQDTYLKLDLSKIPTDMAKALDPFLFTLFEVLPNGQTRSS
jgi:hypothetical protein